MIALQVNRKQKKKKKPTKTTIYFRNKFFFFFFFWLCNVFSCSRFTQYLGFRTVYSGISLQQ